eukprot:753985-Hanusia_phi.AAC.6
MSRPPGSCRCRSKGWLLRRRTRAGRQKDDSRCRTCSCRPASNARALSTRWTSPPGTRSDNLLLSSPSLRCVSPAVPMPTARRRVGRGNVERTLVLAANAPEAALAHAGPEGKREALGSNIRQG